MATIEFTAVGEGTTSLVLTDSTVNPWAGNGVPIHPSFLEGNLTVSAVPVPAAMWLFCSGLIGLASVAKRKVNA